MKFEIQVQLNFVPDFCVESADLFHPERTMSFVGRNPFVYPSMTAKKYIYFEVFPIGGVAVHLFFISGPREPRDI